MAAKLGDTVRVHYTGRLPDGTVFDSSTGSEPLEFTLGEGNILPGFEKAVLGMSPGDSKTFEIPADLAYGPHHDDRVLTVPLDDMPAKIRPAVGQMLELRQPSGRALPVKVTALTDDEITLDANHPLAGQDLTFEALLVEIV